MYEGDILYDTTVGRLTELLDEEDTNYVVDSPAHDDDRISVSWRDGERAKALQFRFDEQDDGRYAFDINGYIWEGEHGLPSLGSQEWEGVGSDLEAFYDDQDLVQQYPASLIGTEEAVEENPDYIGAMVVEKYTLLEDDLL